LSSREERDTESMCVCVCVWERERERERVSVRKRVKMKIELEGEKEKKWEKCKEERKSIKERSDLYGIEIESSGALKTNGMDWKRH